MEEINSESKENNNKPVNRNWLYTIVGIILGLYCIPFGVLNSIIKLFISIYINFMDEDIKIAKAKFTIHGDVNFLRTELKVISDNIYSKYTFLINYKKFRDKVLNKIIISTLIYYIIYLIYFKNVS